MDNPMTATGAGSGILDLDPHLHHHRIASEEDEDHLPSSAGGAGDDENNYQDPHQSSTSRGKKVSPWQRMKWTDDVVRLLIQLVAFVGDDAAPEKHGGATVLQKKGKWKAVSRLMLERDCYVSPQQCEDKFNDLNKRYKRLNEILGRGTSCQVVENPALLDSMPHISPKAKDDVKKILSSKHLFYREMCAYHNGQKMPSCHPNVAPLKHGDDNEEEEEEDVDEEDDEENRSCELGKRGLESLRAEMEGVLKDGMWPPWEQKEWFKRQALQLRAERVEIEEEGFELEKRRFKWERFRSKKDRELERQRLRNERMRLENERMLIHVRQQELELELKWASGATNATAGGFRLDGEQGHDQMELGRVQCQYSLCHRKSWCACWLSLFISCS
ncbi:uncharacterized protein [Typha angustifolia]|uniref:uncharacterized protein n=1 Tax=Typha angustifolia TaxID=59011 RepID=UPI003C2C5552